MLSIARLKLKMQIVILALHRHDKLAFQTAEK